MTKLRCPTCETLFDIANTTAMPFCSERCRLIDLGRWLNEEQGLPYVPHPDDELDENWPDEPQ